jgi:Leucine-rich repeat (LRR) protein
LCRGGSADWKPFIESVERHPTLTRLSLDDCGLDCTHADLFAELIMNTQSLVYLDLPDNEIMMPGALVILEALKANVTLKRVDLEDNNITDELTREIRLVAEDIVTRQQRGTNIKSARKR